MVMSKKQCLLCEKGFGRFSIMPKTIRDCCMEGLYIEPFLPDDHTYNDHICNDCFALLKRKSKERVEEYRKKWGGDGVIQFKNERIAVLHRTPKIEVSFIIAYDDLTKEGYRCVAQDEGMQVSVGVVSGGINSYYYFQKIECVGCGVNAADGVA